MKILISRIDSIGDVILTLPLCGWIKSNVPDAEVHFLCQPLTVDIIKKSCFIDDIHIWNGELPEVEAIIHVFPSKEVARAALRRKIPVRIGSSHRLFHLITCNRLVNFTRIKSDLHEAQLNFKLLKGLGHEVLPAFNELTALTGWNKRPDIGNRDIRFILIMHIKSRGSAKEWSANNYLELAKCLPDNKFKIVLTGTQTEGEMIREEIPGIFELPNVEDTTGSLNLEGLIDLIESADGLLACSTGPLHIASVAGIRALGLYPKIRPMHAGRWGPIGHKSSYLEEQVESKDKFLEIQVNEVKDKIMTWIQA